SAGSGRPQSAIEPPPAPPPPDPLLAAEVLVEAPPLPLVAALLLAEVASLPPAPEALTEAPPLPALELRREALAAPVEADVAPLEPPAPPPLWGWQALPASTSIVTAHPTPICRAFEFMRASSMPNGRSARILQRKRDGAGARLSAVQAPS